MSFIMLLTAAQLVGVSATATIDCGTDPQQAAAPSAPACAPHAILPEPILPPPVEQGKPGPDLRNESESPGQGAQSDQRTIVVAARRRHAPGDPMEVVNAKSYAVTQSVDKAFVGPIAMGYRHLVPSPIRSGLHNATTNLREPTIFINYLLQLKPGKAAATLVRFTINSTVGVAGLIDVAKRRPFDLPHHPNGFADSFGFYGIRSGPYMFLPLVGPTTLRDLIGGGLDRLLLPIVFGQPFNQLSYSIPTGVVSTLDHRVEIDDQLHQIRGASRPYAAMRMAYLLRRQAEIDDLEGK